MFRSTGEPDDTGVSPVGWNIWMFRTTAKGLEPELRPSVAGQLEHRDVPAGIRAGSAANGTSGVPSYGRTGGKGLGTALECPSGGRLERPVFQTTSEARFRPSS